MQQRVIKASVIDIIGAKRASAYRKVLNLEEKESWQLWVPSDIDKSKPVGLMVYVSPQESGELPESWRPVLSQQNMLWIGIDNAGNKRLAKERILLAVLAPMLAMKYYLVAPSRTYIAGTSGGGRVASQLMSLAPESFSGAMYMVGVDKLPRVSRPQLGTLKEKRFVFITGSKDFNRKETRRVYKKYLRKGIVNSYLLDVEGAGHALPSADSIEKSLVYLDGK
ncbi:MAG: hypothetical protein COA42_13580 [Alteromonadaceae bacterium]|nr:MAG: hypothetical protein COA42_13580 [Alteromonadaceae bacterium]